MLLTDVDERDEALINLADFVGILLIGIVDMAELSSRVNIIAGVDPHLLADGGSGVGHSWVEMDVGHKGHVASVGSECFSDGFHVERLPLSLGGEAYDFASCLHNPFSLCHGRLSVHGGCVGHGLNAYRV